MILANSANNSAKRPRAQYLTKRKKAEQEISPHGYELGEQYAAWFLANYALICAELKGNYSEDVISLTYIKIWESVVYRQELPDNLLTYTVRAIYTNDFQQRLQDQKAQHLHYSLSTGGSDYDQPFYDEILEDTRDAEMQLTLERENAFKELCDDVIDYLFNVFSLEEASLFRLYILLKPKCSIAQLAKLGRISIKRAAEIIKNCKLALLTNEKFKKRFAEITNQKIKINQEYYDLFNA